MNDTAPDTDVEVGIRYTARAWALKLHEALAIYAYVVVVAHRRSGKSFAAAATLCMAALAVPGRYGLGSTTKTQLKLIYWAVFKELLDDIPGVEFAEGEVAIRFSNGSEILFFGLQDGDGQSVRGTGLSGFVLDEAQLVTEAAFTGAIRPALTDKDGWLLVIGTPREPSLLGQLHEYASTSGDPDWRGLHFPVDQTGVFAPAQIERLKAEALNDHVYRQEFECVLTAQAENKLLSLPAILAASKRVAPAKAPARSSHPTIVGVDIGGPGHDGDKSCICVRTGPHVTYLGVVDPEELDNLPLLVAAAIRQYRADLCLVDSTGGHASSQTYRLQRMGYTVVPVIFSASASNTETEANKRAEMYRKLADWVKRPDVTIPNDRALIKELAAITYKHDSKGRLLLEPKDRLRVALGHSPDRADALALTMLGDLMAPQEEPKFFPHSRRRGDRYQSDYPSLKPHDPYGEFDPFSGSNQGPLA